MKIKDKFNKEDKKFEMEMLKFLEKQFKELDFPEAKSHITAHNLFRKKIKEFKKLNPEEAGNIADFARDWLSDHILAVDHQYSQFFLAHDVK